MNLYLHLLLFASLFSSLIFILQNTWKRRNNVSCRPPGPPGLPLIGNLREFSSSLPHLYLHELSKIYGPLVSLKLGSVPTLVVSSAKMAKEVLKTHDSIFSNRPKLATQQKLSYKGFDIAFAPLGEHWRQVKKVCVLNLFSSKKVYSFSSIRQEEVHQMTKKISRLSEEGVAVDLSEMAICYTNSIICKIAFGRKYDFDARNGRSFDEMLKEAEELLASFCFADYFPFMGWVVDKITGMSAHLQKVFMEWDEFYEGIIHEHLNSVRCRTDEEDIVDVLLDLQRDKSLAIHITMDHVKAILMNIFIAGTDTVAATIIWAMTMLIKNPDSMKRVQEEARSVMREKIGGTAIQEEDLGKLLYLKAVVKETLRLHPSDPLLLPRETTRKCTIQGYEIEEKTVVLVNVWAIGRDPDAWEDPELFRPERFIGNGVDMRGQHFELIPFGAGRRMCPGLQLGEAMVELALANLVCSFDWAVPVGMEEQVMDTSVLPGIATFKKYPLCLMGKCIWLTLVAFGMSWAMT